MNKMKKVKDFVNNPKKLTALIVGVCLVGLATLAIVFSDGPAEAPKTTDKVTAQKKDTKKTEVKKEKAKAEEKKTETKIDENKEETTKAEEKKSESAHKPAPANKSTVSKPSTGGSNSGASNSSTTTTQKPKQKVWIVDKPAWTETIQVPNYKSVLMVKVKTLTMGVQIMTDDEFTACVAMDPTPEKCRGSWSQFTETVQDGYLTQTVNHPEEGHWEWR
jgi:hypothetical protein